MRYTVRTQENRESSFHTEAFKAAKIMYLGKISQEQTAKISVCIPFEHQLHLCVIILNSSA